MEAMTIFVGNEEKQVVAVGMPDGTIGYLPPASAAQYQAMLRNGSGFGGGGYSPVGQGQQADLGKVVRMFGDAAQVVIDLKTRNDIIELRKDAKAEQAKIDSLQDKLKAALSNVSGGAAVADVLIQMNEATKNREYAERKALARLATAAGVSALNAGGRLLGQLLPSGQGGFGYQPSYNGGALAIGGVGAAIALSDIWKEKEKTTDDDY